MAISDYPNFEKQRLPISFHELYYDGLCSERESVNLNPNGRRMHPFVLNV